MEKEKEVMLVVCDEKAWDADAASVYDINTGQKLICIPNCMAPSCGLAYVPGRLLAASRSDKDRPFVGGAIYFWALSKLQTTYRSHVVEAIGPIACSKDGMYLLAGAPSGNAYIWEITSGALLKSWCAHKRPISCLAFSQDSSLIISGSEEGTVCAWSMINLLNTDETHLQESTRSFPMFHIWTKHHSYITGLLTFLGASNPILISSSHDGSCKIRELMSGRLLQTMALSNPVTAIAVDPLEQLLLCGVRDGGIYAGGLIGVAMEEHAIKLSKEDCRLLSGHMAPISALAFSSEGVSLVSASKDCTILIWDAITWHVLRKLQTGKGPISNLLMIPKSMLQTSHHKRRCLPFKVPTLEKTCGPTDATSTFLLPSNCSRDGQSACASFCTSDLLNEQILDLERKRTSEAIELLVATNIGDKAENVAMAKELFDMNKQLRPQLIDVMQAGLCKD